MFDRDGTVIQENDGRPTFSCQSGIVVIAEDGVDWAPSDKRLQEPSGQFRGPTPPPPEVSEVAGYGENIVIDGRQDLLRRSQHSVPAREMEVGDVGDAQPSEPHRPTVKQHGTFSENHRVFCHCGRGSFR